MPTPLAISELFEKAKEDLVKIELQAHGARKRVILNLAQDLEKAGMLTHTICQEMVAELRGVTHPSHIRRCLDNKYKDPKQSSNAKQQKGYKRNQHGISDNNLARQISPDIEHEKRPIPILIDNRGQSVPAAESFHPPTIDSRAADPSSEHKDQKLIAFRIPKAKVNEIKKHDAEIEKYCIVYADSNYEVVIVEPDNPARQIAVKKPSSRNHYKKPESLKNFEFMLKLNDQLKTIGSKAAAA